MHDLNHRGSRGAIAPVTNTIPVRITLARIRRELAVVLIVGDAVIVVVTVTTITDAVVV